MSKLSRLITTIAITATVSLAGPAAGAQSRSNPALDQMIQALGGQAFMDVKEIQVNGRFFSFTRGELSGSDIFVDYIKFPDMERTEFGFNKNKSITINKGTEGWKIEPKEKEAQPIPGKACE